MASIAFRNSSRRLLRAYFSKLGWQANVIWRIAFFNQLQVYPSWLWTSDLFRASLAKESRLSLCGWRHQCWVLAYLLRSLSRFSDDPRRGLAEVFALATRSRFR